MNKLEHLKSLKSLQQLLEEIKSHPKKHNSDMELIKSLKSQGGLASYSNKNYGINSRSLNTLKSHADEELDDGFTGLDRLRKNALLSLEQSYKIPKIENRKTKLGLLQLVKLLEADVSLLEKENILLTSIISKQNAMLRQISIKVNMVNITTDVDHYSKEIASMLSHVRSTEL